MQKVFLTLLLVLVSTVAVFAQSNKTYASWEDVIRGMNNGEQEAVAIVLDAKKQLETSDVWTSEVRDDYITLIRVLLGYCGDKDFYKDQETIINDAMKVFCQRDSVANNPQTRLLWGIKTKSLADIKDYGSVIQCGRKALSMYYEANDYGYNYCYVCADMSTAYLQLGDVLDAKLYADEAFDIIQQLVSSGLSKDWGYYHILNLRGLIYSELKQYEKSIACLKEVVDNCSPEVLGSPFYLSLNNLAGIYLISNRVTECIELLNKVHDETPDLRSQKYENLAIAYMLAGNKQKASESLGKYDYEAFLDEFRVVMNFSEVEREAYMSNKNKEMVFINNIIATNAGIMTEEAFEINVLSRQISLTVNKYLKSCYMHSPAFKELDARRQELIAKGLSPVKRDSIKNDIIALEKDIIRSDTAFIENMPFDEWSYDTIAGALNSDEAIVLFCYAPKLKSGLDFEARYGAFVIRKGDKQPRLVQLGGVDETEDIFFNKAPSIDFISKLYADQNAQKLYMQLWKPLEQQLEGANRIYYSTVGPLSTINIEALKDSAGVRLRDKYEMLMLSSPSEKPNESVMSKANDFVAFGDPAFNLSLKEMTDNSGKYDQFSGEDVEQQLRLRGETLRGNWQEIPGTKKEIKKITSLMKNKGVKGVAYLGEGASEEAFKSLSGHSPKVLHVATHGFVVTDDEQYEKNNFAKSVSGLTRNNNYMLWTGLILSGGNNAWKGEQIPDGVEDGILTADEIARLDLSNTDLVVLSACETARGHIDPLEGVWGLQRAFKQAGVKTIVMTLWKVSDDVTAMFMEQFYKHLLKGKTVRQSVKMAQNYLISHGASDPFYWAPFIVLD